MTAPRIEPGGLCIVTKPDFWCETLRGRVVTVVSRFMTNSGPAWNIDREVRFVMTADIRDSRGIARYAGDNRGLTQVMERWLTPITPSPGTDTEHTDTPADAVPA